MDIPRHVAIIMDGNGRWAKARGMATLSWPTASVQRVLVQLFVVRGELGIEVLTLFTLSEDNLSRTSVKNWILLWHCSTAIWSRNVWSYTAITCICAPLATSPACRPRTQRLIEETSCVFTRQRWPNPQHRPQLSRSQTKSLHACRTIAQRIERGELQSTDVSPQLIDNSLQNCRLA